MLKIAVLVSGGGTNLQAIIDGLDSGKITNASLEVVISNNYDVFALKRAEAANIPNEVISPKDFADRATFNHALIARLQELEIDLVVLAGYLVVIPPEMVQAFPHRIINVHPSLIPSFCGTGYYGLKVHEAALARGVKYTGATVHFVDEGTDTGPIILQKPVRVLEEDEPKDLQRRVMEEAEWKLLPQAIHLIANNKVSVVDGVVQIDED